MGKKEAAVEVKIVVVGLKAHLKAGKIIKNAQNGPIRSGTEFKSCLPTMLSLQSRGRYITPFVQALSEAAPGTEIIPACIDLEALSSNENGLVDFYHF